MTDAQRLYAMYVICAVESGWAWDAVNYSDPITLGIAQWYGTRAAGLLLLLEEKAPSSYAKIADTLKSAMASHGTSDSWWTSRYITQVEGDSFKEAAKDSDCHAVQQELFMSDMTGYEQTFEKWGVGSDRPKELIFIASMYHQSPRYCVNVVQSVGGASSLDRLYNACLNNRVLGQYRSRYNRVYRLLNGWDGVSSPPDFGQVEGIGQPGDIGSDGGTSSTGQASGIQCVKLYGNDILAVVGTSGTETLCYKTNGNIWYPRVRSTAARNPGTGESSTSGGTEISGTVIDKMIALYMSWENRFSYSQAAGRLSPLTSGYSDCGGSIWSAVNYIDPDIAKDWGTWTVGMLNDSSPIIAQGSNNERIPIEKMKKGDILLVDFANWGREGNPDHVEWYIGDNKLWGFNNMVSGPSYSGTAEDYAIRKTLNHWWVKRHYI